jgi:hypothetical protein
VIHPPCRPRLLFPLRSAWACPPLSSNTGDGLSSTHHLIQPCGRRRSCHHIQHVARRRQGRPTPLGLQPSPLVLTGPGLSGPPVAAMAITPLAPSLFPHADRGAVSEHLVPAAGSLDSGRPQNWPQLRKPYDQRGCAAPAAAARTIHRSATTVLAASASEEPSALRGARCVRPGPYPLASQLYAALL